jgi:mannosyltransferase
MDQRKIRPADYAVLALILLVAAVLRVLKLDSPLWYDEILTLVDTLRLPFEELLTGFTSLNNHLFYSIQAKATIGLFGESNWSLRLPAAVFGVASIAAMWRLAFMVSGPIQAHVTAVLIACSYHHVWFSQNARGYTGLMFWFIVSTLLLIRGVREPAMRTWVWYGLSVVAGMYTHLTAAPFFVAHAVIVGALLLRPQWNRRVGQAGAVAAPLTWRMPVTGFVLAAVLTLMVYAPSIPDVLSDVADIPGSSSVDVMTEYQSPLWAAREIIRTVIAPGPLALIVGFSVVALVGIGMFRTHQREPILGMILLLHVPLMLIILLSLSMRIWPRFFFPDMGFILFFMAQGVFMCCQVIHSIARKMKIPTLNARGLFVLSAIAMLIISSILLARNYRFPKQDFEGVLTFVEASRAETDEVTMLGLASVPYTRFFTTDWHSVETVDQLAAVQSGARRTWLVIAFPGRTARRYADVMKYVDAQFSIVGEFPGTLGDGAILVYADKTTE